MQDVAGNSEAIILDRLTPSTQYSIVVSAVWLGKKYRSRQIIFRTLGKYTTTTKEYNKNNICVKKIETIPTTFNVVLVINLMNPLNNKLEQNFCMC